MSRHRKKSESSDLSERLSALDEARQLGEGRLPAASLADVYDVLERATSRRSLSAGHTVVGFFGATGSGKSSLFNAVTGSSAATVAARRPTTSEPLAGVWGIEGSEPLLDWLDVNNRQHMDDGEGPGGDAADGGDGRGGGAADGTHDLILLDLPDFDSTAHEHRKIVEKMAGQVDVLVWVLDPQKYADAAVHYGFLRPLASHGAVTLVVLNQVDRLQEREVEPVVKSLRGLLAQDGLVDAEVHPVSAVTGAGVDVLRQKIQQVAARREAATQRLMADVGRAVKQLEAASNEEGAPTGHLPASASKKPVMSKGGPSTDAAKQKSSAKMPSPSVGKSERQQLVDQLAGAARVEAVVDAVARSYRRRARAQTGWPVTRWLGKFRPDPLRRLNLGRDDVNPELNRTSMPEPGAAERAKADSAVRAFAESASDGAPEPWKASIRRASRASQAELPDALDQAIAGTDLRANRKSWWWPVIGLVQWLALAAAVAGAGWLGFIAVMGYLQLPVLETPRVEGFPLPTLLLLGSVLLGILLAITSGFFARLGARSRARNARRRLRAAVGAAADKHVTEPVQEEIDRLGRFNAALVRARGL
ncbi:GTPase [Arthrobacter monumenti]